MRPEIIGRCPSCWEKHGDICPPHEVRTTGVAWYREYIDDLEHEIERLRSATDHDAVMMRTLEACKAHGYDVLDAEVIFTLAILDELFPKEASNAHQS